MHDAVADGVVWPKLPVASDQGHVNRPAEAIDRFGCRLTAEKRGVKLLNVRDGKLALRLDESEHALKRLLLISEELEHEVARLVGRAVTEQLGMEPMLDEGLSNTPVDVVKVLDDTRLNRPLAAEAFREVGQLLRPAQPLPLI